MHTNEIKQAIKNDDFLTFRKLLKQHEIDIGTKTELIKAIQSYIGGASQETYINALNEIGK